jgi:hypothetical protein
VLSLCCGPGPHVMEIVAREAQLHWPYLLQLDVVWEVAEVFSRFFCVPGAPPHPPARGPSQWMYINVVLHCSELFLPLPVALPSVGDVASTHPQVA